MIATSSPSMDIQLASNFERLLFELAGRDGAESGRAWKNFAETGPSISKRETSELRALFAAPSIDEHETAMTIRRSLCGNRRGLIDPHTAVGLAAARQENFGTPMIVLSTAHPAKFPDAIERAIGRVPEQPERLKARLGQEERLTVLAQRR